MIKSDFILKICMFKLMRMDKNLFFGTLYFSLNFHFGSNMVDRAFDTWCSLIGWIYIVTDDITIHLVPPPHHHHVS